MKIFVQYACVAVLVPLAAACSASSATRSSAVGGTARVSVGGATYEVRDVVLTIEPGQDGWYRIEGEPVTHADEDCVPGLGGGLGLYGDLTAAVQNPGDLAGRRLRVDFSGDGDDANFCFLGMGGLAGAEDAWVQFDQVTGNRVSFSMSGTFKVYDENGDGPVQTATASGTAVLQGT